MKIPYASNLARFSRKKFWASLFCLSLLYSPFTNADQLDSRLIELFQQMQRTRSPLAATEIESAIWQVWLDHDNPVFYKLMAQGIQAMNRNSPYEALDTFDRLIEQAPKYAEAWNKRATIYYVLGEYGSSQADIEQTLLLEPKHFGALSGLGLIHLAQGEYSLARNAFNSAIEINPFMPGVINNLNSLEEYFDDN